MPQVADLFKSASQGVAPASRKQLTMESNTKKFDNFLANHQIQSRKYEPVESSKSHSSDQIEDSEETEPAESRKTESGKTSKKEASSKTRSKKEVEPNEDENFEPTEAADHVHKKESHGHEEESDDQSETSSNVVELIKAEKSDSTSDEPEVSSDTFELSSQLQAIVNPQTDQTSTEKSESVDSASGTTIQSKSEATKLEQIAANKSEAIESDSSDKASKIELPEGADAEEDMESDLQLAQKSTHDFKNLKLDQPEQESSGTNPDLLKTADLSGAQKTHSPISSHAAVQIQSTAAPERDFAENNVDRIVTTMNGNISTNGGTMKIRLDPPNLGELQVDITVDRDGTLSASFQTSNDEATRLLSHNLQNLKTSLETSGVTVDKIQVKQTSPSEQSSSQNSGERDQQQQNPQDHPARQEQQRREILEKMWRKMVFGDEPLDLVA